MSISGDQTLFQRTIACAFSRIAPVLEHSSVLHLMLLGCDGGVLWANTTMGKFLGCEVPLPPGRRITEFLTSVDGDRVKGYLDGTEPLPEGMQLVNFILESRVPQTLLCSFIPAGTKLILLAEPMIESNRSLQEELLQLNNHLAVLSRENTRKGRELEKTVRALSQEIEQRRKAETELLRHQNQLEELVRYRTAELEIARDAAEAASRAKSAFLANMSHELRTPMNAIMSFAYLMKNDPLTPRQLDQLEKLSTAARQLLGILNDILDISRIEFQQISLEVQDFEPVQVIEHVRKAVYDKAVSKGLDLLIELGSLPLMVRGDARRLGQVLLNLVGNAVKFTEKGRITLACRATAWEEKGVTLCFEVRDTGIGMTDEQLGRLFQAFEQGDNAKTRRFGGLGLGLAISKRFVELMGGRLSVESEFGRGSLFRLEIPLEISQTMSKPVGHFPSTHGMRTLAVPNVDEPREPLPTAGLNGYETRPVELERPSETEVKSVDWARVGEAIGQLEPLLATDNTMVNEVFEQWETLLIEALGDEAGQLKRQIQDFDYADALKTLGAVRKTRPIQEQASEIFDRWKGAK